MAKVADLQVADLKIFGSGVQTLFAAELTPGGVDSAYHPSEVGKMSTSVTAKKAAHEGKGY